MPTIDNQQQEAELDALLTQAGIAVPPERRDGMVQGFAEVRNHVKRIWQFETASEPMPIVKLQAPEKRHS